MRSSALALAATVLLAGHATAEPLMDPLSRAYMEAAKSTSGCAAATVVATGLTEILEQEGLSNGWETEFYAELIGEDRAYELEFELGSEFSRKNLELVLALVLTYLRLMKELEEEVSIPREHAKLLEKRKTEALGFSIGFYVSAPVEMLGDEVLECRDTILDAFSRIDCEGEDLADPASMRALACFFHQEWDVILQRN